MVLISIGRGILPFLRTNKDLADMAIARVSTGEVYASYEGINQVVAPLQVGTFDLSAEAKSKLAELPMPLDDDGVKFLFDSLDSDAIAMVENEGFVYRRAGCLMPPQEDRGLGQFVLNDLQGTAVAMEMSAEDLKAYATPHYVLAGDIHCVFTGMISKGLVMEDGRQAVVYVQAGEWIRLNQTILNWPIFAADAPGSAVSYFDRKPSPETNNYDMDIHPEVEVLPEMVF